MTAVASRRPPAFATHSLPPGRGDLHAALVASSATAGLSILARNLGCDRADISTPDGKQVDLQRAHQWIHERMRSHGYLVEQPVKPTEQPKLRQGFITWTVQITLPNAGPTLTLAYLLPATAK